MKLNPSKCVFAIKGGKFIGLLVSSKGIEPYLKKIQVILGMTPSWLMKEFQLLPRQLVSFNQFISHIGEHSMPFFKTLKNISNFEWTSKC
jgi:hypothetical protein